jgi:hypothetical protein
LSDRHTRPRCKAGGRHDSDDHCLPDDRHHCPPARRVGAQAQCGRIHAAPVEQNAALTKLDKGRQTFRFDTFGDEAFWGGALRLHEAIATVPPRMALDLGLTANEKSDLVEYLKSLPDV